MRRVDIGTGAFVVAFGAFGVSQSLDLPLFQRGGIPGPGMFPLILSIALVVLGGLVILSRLRAKPAEYPPFEAPSRDELTRVMAVMGGLAVSIALLPVVGYLASTMLLVAFLVLWVERLRSWRAVLTVIALPGVFFLLFVVLLKVRLPVGFWDN